MCPTPMQLCLLMELTAETLEGREGGLVFGENFFANETAVYKTMGLPNTVQLLRLKLCGVIWVDVMLQ